MRISELSRESGVPLATVKFYLREGLLQPGRRTSATQAVYGPEHVARLRLVRALVETGGLSLARTREVLAGLQSPSLWEAVGHAHSALGDAPDEVGTARVGELLDRVGWAGVDEHCPAARRLAAALAALEDVGLPMTDDHLLAYASAARAAAEVDVASVPTDSPTDAVTTVVLGTVLREPVLLALRRLAQQSQAATAWGGAGEVPGNGRSPAT